MCLLVRDTGTSSRVRQNARLVKAFPLCVEFVGGPEQGFGAALLTASWITSPTQARLELLRRHSLARPIFKLMYHRGYGRGVETFLGGGGGGGGVGGHTISHSRA